MMSSDVTAKLDFPDVTFVIQLDYRRLENSASTG